MFSALQSIFWSRNRCQKQRPNRYIIGDAIHPQTGTKLTKNAVRNLAVCVAPSDTTEENRNIGAQLQSILCTSAEKNILENLRPVGLLVRTNLFIPSRFWTTSTKFDS